MPEKKTFVFLTSYSNVCPGRSNLFLFRKLFFFFFSFFPYPLLNLSVLFRESFLGTKTSQAGHGNCSTDQTHNSARQSPTCPFSGSNPYFSRSKHALFAAAKLKEHLLITTVTLKSSFKVRQCTYIVRFFGFPQFRFLILK